MSYTEDPITPYEPGIQPIDYRLPLWQRTTGLVRSRKLATDYNVRYFLTHRERAVHAARSYVEHAIALRKGFGLQLSHAVTKEEEKEVQQKIAQLEIRFHRGGLYTDVEEEGDLPVDRSYKAGFSYLNDLERNLRRMGYYMSGIRVETSELGWWQSYRNEASKSDTYEARWATWIRLLVSWKHGQQANQAWNAAFHANDTDLYQAMMYWEPSPHTGARDPDDLSEGDNSSERSAHSVRSGHGSEKSGSHYSRRHPTHPGPLQSTHSHRTRSHARRSPTRDHRARRNRSGGPDGSSFADIVKRVRKALPVEEKLSSLATELSRRLRPGSEGKMEEVVQEYIIDEAREEQKRRRSRREGSPVGRRPKIRTVESQRKGRQRSYGSPSPSGNHSSSIRAKPTVLRGRGIREAQRVQREERSRLGSDKERGSARKFIRSEGVREEREVSSRAPSLEELRKNDKGKDRDPSSSVQDWIHQMANKYEAYDPSNGSPPGYTDLHPKQPKPQTHLPIPSDPIDRPGSPQPTRTMFPPPPTPGPKGKEKVSFGAPMTRPLRPSKSPPPRPKEKSAGSDVKTKDTAVSGEHQSTSDPLDHIHRKPVPPRTDPPPSESDAKSKERGRTEETNSAVEGSEQPPAPPFQPQHPPDPPISRSKPKGKEIAGDGEDDISSAAPESANQVPKLSLEEILGLLTIGNAVMTPVPRKNSKGETVEVIYQVSLSVTLSTASAQGVEINDSSAPSFRSKHGSAASGVTSSNGTSDTRKASFK